MIRQVSSPNQISRLVLHGYKSIDACDLEFGSCNILIGANGAGKSNLIGFFKLINRMLEGQLQTAVGLAGGPDAILHFGRKQTEELSADLHFGDKGYRFALRATEDNRLMFVREALWGETDGQLQASAGHFESHVDHQKDKTPLYQSVVLPIRSWHAYHFHDTSASALVKQVHNINDNVYLRDDARNLAAFLLRLKDHHREHFQRIVKTIRLVSPFFGGFHLRPRLGNPEKIQLEWHELGQDEPFTASALSDGTLRFICLATLLLQPRELMPATILIDEPELGLHPFAITVLAGLMKSVLANQQLIVSTQSVELVNHFEVEDLIVVEKRANASVFHRPDPNTLTDWLDDYSLGELWQKNLLGGRPSR